MRVILLVVATLSLVGCSGEPPVQWELDDPHIIRVPSMASAPILDRQMAPGEWSAARAIEGTFVIRDGTLAEGDYPFKLLLGHDERNIFIAATIQAGPNPWTTARQDEDGIWAAGGAWYPDFLDLFFAMGSEGELTVPSDWKAFANQREQGSHTDDGYWTGRQWVNQNEGPGGGFRFNDGRPEGGTWGRGGFTEDSLFWEIYIPRTPVRPVHDGLDIPDGRPFRMGMLFVRQGVPTNETDHFGFPRDAFPGDGPTPDNHVRPETWLKLALE